jgi:hypothetical protein
MIRLVFALLALVALPSPSLAASGPRRELTVAVGAEQHLAPAPRPELAAGGPPLPSLPSLAPPAWRDGAGAASHSFVVIARLWLRAHRLLC